MNEIIKINKSVIGNDEVNSVNAREIHNYLEVKTPFSMWVQRAIKKYDFVENVDFTIHKIVNGKNAMNEYIVSLDMAKELAMLENNKKGKEIRKYFIAMEKKATSGAIAGVDNQVLSMMAQQNSMMMEFMKTQETQNKLIFDMLSELKTAKISTTTSETLEPWQLDAIKQRISEQADWLWEEHPQLSKRLFGSINIITKNLYARINDIFGVKSYYYIKAKDFDKAIKIISTTRYKEQEKE
jgi:phage anti-repressor protein